MMVPVVVWLCVLLASGSSFILDGIPQPVNIYVSPHGNDHNDGRSVHHPVKTFRKTATLLKSHSLQNKDVTVNLMQGYYDLDSTLHINHQGPHTVTIQAYNDQEVHVNPATPVMSNNIDKRPALATGTGGKRIPSNLFHKVTNHSILQRLPLQARDKVYQVKLSAAGITNLGQLTPYGFYKTRHAPLEVFYNGAPLRLARWPNEGFINIKHVLDGTHGRRFSYDSDRPRRWSSENDLWTFGYWYWSWADLSAKVQSIDTVNNVVELQHATRFGLREGKFNNQSNTDVRYLDQGGYFRFLNVLGEIDEPGEYYVDRSSGILYLWPPTSAGLINNQDIIYASLIDDCVNFGSSNNMVFRGFTVEACRTFGMRGNHVNRITIDRMEIKNTGSYNIDITADSRNITVSRCNLHDGDGGIVMMGGDRATLTPSGNLVTDNLIWRFGRETGVGANALSLSGVGTLVQYNNMHTGQYTAIRWSRGNIIRKNHIHHTLRFLPGADVRGIMLDDQYSSVTIEDNVFYDNEVHTNIGGGRDNIIRNNIFYNATLSAMQVDSRGVKHTNDGSLYNSLKKVPFKTGIWASKYPKLAVIEANSPSEPRGNQIYNNIFYGSKTSNIVGLVRNLDWFNVTGNAYSDLTSDFYDVGVKDFRPRCMLSQFTQRVHFPVPVQLNETGPRYPVGPVYNSKKYAEAHLITSQSPSPCATYAPATLAPRGSYLPDGSAPNTIHSTPKHGCWLFVEKCAAHPELISGNQTQFYKDSDSMASTRQSSCLQRVPHYVQYCGSESFFYIIYGPTGAMTLGGNAGCFFADFGCPDHNHHLPKTGNIYHDYYAERAQNASHVQQNCLLRPLAQYRYCGSHENYPITSIFLPTGNTVTAGGGCWIQMDACVADTSIHNSFYDALGASSAGSDISPESCFSRAEYYWHHCGSHRSYPVTAFYRPEAVSYVYPSS